MFCTRFKKQIPETDPDPTCQNPKPKIPTNGTVRYHRKIQEYHIDDYWLIYLKSVKNCRLTFNEFKVNIL